MEVVQLFLDINRPGLNNQWNAEITEAIKGLPSAEQVMVIENNESTFAQISISYKVEELPFARIENAVVDSEARITDINIHFPSDITGVASPYRASAVSIAIDEKLTKIDGVLSNAISSNGELKVVLDITAKDKQAAIDEILKICSSMKSGNASL